MKFVYFRSARCESSFKWNYLGIINRYPDIEVEEESYASKKTFLFTSLYLVINFLLIVTAVVALCKYLFESFNRFLSR